MARGKWTQGVFKPKNPEKYVGKGTIKYRSGWELTAFRMLDEHPSILNWASESIIIPYLDPLTNKKKNYIPDLFIIYRDKDGNQKTEIVEIKPSSQAGVTKARSIVEQAQVIKNQAKWVAAQQFCQKHGMGFRVVTEKDLFR